MKLALYIAAIVCFVLAVVFAVLPQSKAYQICVALGLAFFAAATGPIG